MAELYQLWELEWLLDDARDPRLLDDIGVTFSEVEQAFRQHQRATSPVRQMLTRHCARGHASVAKDMGSNALTDEVIRSGGCLCGAVRYEVHGEPYIAGLCHCAICRKLTGSVVSATASWRREQFAMHGDVRTFERRQFCPTCGSRLFYLLDDSVEIFLGTLDAAPNDIKPHLEVWAIRREPWLPPIPGIAVHDQNPPKEA